ncbi:5' nucleotidase, NT5C type [Membranihabitans maritimus]|uniref:5' nucleotidase, NT5C type n=1 Tax=Membranihabitans maritimus TaxID=2904244 RepID=UPI001F3300AE|nr:5'(3')-deoxyribonucleotidase [Membranihabitans maritimus]
MKLKKPILGVDMDDVLADSYQQSLDWYERDFGIKYTKEELEGQYLGDVIAEDQIDIINSYFFTEGFFRTIKPIDGAIEGMRLLQEEYDVFIVTAAQQFPQCLTEKNEWLDEYMPFIDWQHRIFCGHKYFLDAKYLIDDHAYNFEYFKGSPILFSAPHNAGETRFFRVNNWEETLTYLNVTSKII